MKWSHLLSRKNRETKDRVPNRKIATGGRVRCPAPSGAAVTLLIDACKPRLGAPPPSLVAALQLWAWSNAQYTVFSEGAARHFCLVGETAPAIYQAIKEGRKGPAYKTPLDKTVISGVMKAGPYRPTSTQGKCVRNTIIDTRTWLNNLT